ncbi:MAG: amino acid ABC transporter substrate-binding protein [Gammaproteobacteria bacterium]
MRKIILLLSLAALIGNVQAASGTLKRIADSGEIKIGYRAATEPFSFQDSSGQATGYSVELCQRIAEAVRTELKLKDIKLTYVPVTLEERFNAVEKKKVDIICSATTITLSRMAKVDFSLMTFVTGGSLMSRSSSPIQMTSDLSGKKVAVISGTTTETGLADYLKENFIEATTVAAENIEAARKMLDEGKVDAVADDQIVLIGQLIASGTPDDYTLSQDLYSYEPYGLALTKDDGEFRLVVDRTLARLYRTGQFKPLYSKWFGRFGLKPTPILQAMYSLQSLPE